MKDIIIGVIIGLVPLVVIVVVGGDSCGTYLKIYTSIAMVIPTLLDILNE